MGKIGLPLLKKDLDSPCSPHFGVAKWILIHDTRTGEDLFERNEGLVGRAVVQLLERHGCKDAVFASIGPGALDHLQEAGIRGWYSPEKVPARELIERLGRGELERATGPREPAGGRLPSGGPAKR